jgi:hypothetical protein
MPVHLIEPEFAPRYWRKFLRCSNGQFVTGFGITPEQAEENAAEERNKVEEFIKLSPIEQLKHLANQEHILDADKEKMLKLIVQILLDK